MAPQRRLKQDRRADVRKMLAAEPAIPPPARRHLKANEIAAIRRAHESGHRIVDLADAYDAHPTVISRIVHGKTHRAVTAMAEPLPDTDTPDSRAARRAAAQRNEALARAAEAEERAEEERKARQDTERRLEEAEELIRKERKAREKAEERAKAARAQSETEGTPADDARPEAEDEHEEPEPQTIWDAHKAYVEANKHYSNVLGNPKSSPEDKKRALDENDRTFHVMQDFGRPARGVES